MIRTFFREIFRKLIHISSTSIYGKSSGVVKENVEKKYLKPQSPYAEIKLIEASVEPPLALTPVPWSECILIVSLAPPSASI